MRVAILLALAVGALRESNATSITFPRASEPEKTAGQDPPKEAADSPLRETAHHVANLGLKTLRDLFSGQSNVVLSPLNVFSCLGILHLGAAGETKEEIRRLLGPRSESSRAVDEVTRSRGGVSYAAAVFLDHGYPPRRDFADAALAQFRASVQSVNVSDGEEAKNTINRWVSDHTNGTIADLLAERLDSETRMVVVSTLLFKGKWLHPFPKAATAPGKFEVDEGTTVSVPLMHLLCSVPLVRNPHFDAVGLPYGDEGGLRMYLILPKAHGAAALRQLLSHLNANSLKKLRREAVSEEVFVVVPKMTIDGHFSLGNSLKKQGVTSMFDPSGADFANLVDGEARLFVSQVHHGVHLEMDEEGTVASAATASILTKSGRFVFRATRPFLFVVADQSDLVLFVGAVVAPQ